MGKTALILGGGGSRGGYEIGVWKALRQLDVKIDMVMGTSVGAINGAMIIQGNFELAESLWKKLETEMIFDIGENLSEENINKNTSDENISIHDSSLYSQLKKKFSQTDIAGMPAEDALAYAKEIFTKGGAGSLGLKSLLEKYIDEELIRASSMQYGLVTTEYPSFKRHFLYLEDIPKGQLIDYILASASCFPAVQKYLIEDKIYIDGGYSDNMPVEMALSKDADTIIAVDLQAAGFIRKGAIETAKNTVGEFRLIKSPLDLGNFLIFDKSNTAKVIELGYLDTMRNYGKYDGIRYTFKKGIFTPHNLAGADSAAYILEINPCIIYEKTDFLKTIGRALEESGPSNLHIQLIRIIAKSLREEKENSVFLHSTVFKLLETEIQAANFLLKQKII